MSAKLTVEWDRPERAGFMPRDSGLVYPGPLMTVEWRPMTTATIIDYDSEAMRIPPGAGPDPGPEPPPADGGGAGGDAGGGGGSSGPFGPPEVFVTRRRTESKFLRQGLIVDLRAPAPARVKAVLTARVDARGRNGKPKRRRVKLTEVVRAEVGTERERLRLRASRAGRRALKRSTKLDATLELIVRYRDQGPVELTRKVRIVEPRR